jgi:hypothetical protein
MSWRPISRARGSNKTGIWLSLSAKDVRITFFPDSFAALKLKDGARVEVCVGEDDHLGRIRLRVTDSGCKARKQGAVALAITFRKWDGLMDDACAAISVPLKVVGDGVVEVQLPYWGQAHKLKAKVTKVA